MIIAVASGKGGTGKTTIATSLAISLAAVMPPDLLVFLDCDVEAPNAHLFLKPTFQERQQVEVLIPSVDETRCTHCGTCAEVCQYHAIAVIGRKTLVFPQLCHGCGSCTLMCPEQAISEVAHEIGVLERGPAIHGIYFGHGVMDVGEPMAGPVIRQLKRWMAPRPEQVVILDAPPGNSCPVVVAVSRSAYLLLVTEPTPFGLHDLRLAVDVATELRIPAGIIINRDGDRFDALEEFCARKGLPIWMRIPLDRTIAEGLARGKPLVEIYPKYAECFQQMYLQIMENGKQRLSGEVVSCETVDDFERKGRNG